MNPSNPTKMLKNKINALKLDGIDEKSWWEKLGDIADVVGDSVKGFALGAKDAVVSTWDGLVSLVTNPKETLEGLAYVIQNPGEALSAAWDAIVESWNTQVINGDAESRGKFFGRAFGEVALAVVGTKGIDKAVKAAKGTKIVQEAANGYKVVKSDVANKVGNIKVPVRVRQEVVVTPDGRNFSMWNVETKPARELYQKFAAKGIDNVEPGDKSFLVPGGGLAAHELKGGHLLERHVGKTDEQLIERLKTDPKITASSTFKDRMTAEKVAHTVLSDPDNVEKIEKWLSDPKSRPKLVLNYKGDGEVIGKSIARDSEVVGNVTNAKIILKKDGNQNFILTGYPVK